MPRPLRIEYEDAYYHVMSRGRDRGRQNIFHSGTYYTAFLDILAEASERFNLIVHGYCLMTNHYHLLVQTPEGNLGRAMRHINGVYTQRHNRLKRTDGPLFRGRYKSILVDEDSYLLQLSRYIHRNPIETRRPMVEKLEDYAWSSYPAYVNQVPAPSWLQREQIYQMLGKKQKYQGYRDYVADGNSEELLRFYNRGNMASVIGEKEFVSWLREEKIPQLEEKIVVNQVLQKELSMDTLLELIAQFYDVKVESFVKVTKGKKASHPVRKIAMYICQQLGGYSLKEIGYCFGLSNIGSVSFATSSVRKEIEQSRRTRQELKRLKEFIIEKAT